MPAIGGRYKYVKSPRKIANDAISRGMNHFHFGMLMCSTDELGLAFLLPEFLATEEEEKVRNLYKNI